MKRSSVRLVLQLVVSVLLLALLARRIDLRDAGAALVRVRPVTIGAAVVLALVGYWGRARRWRTILRQNGDRVSTGTSYRLTLLGLFYGLVTPGRLGELARALHLPMPRSRTLPSVIWDRVADVLLLEVMALPAFAVVPNWRGPLLIAYLGMVGLTMVGIGVLASLTVANLVAAALPFAANPIRRWNANSSGTLSASVLARSLAYGLLFYAFSYTAGWLLLRDIAPGSSPAILLGFPIIPLLGNLPITFSGFGLREQVAASVFEHFGQHAANGTVFGLVWFLTATLLPALAGMLLSLAPSTRAQRVPGGDT